MCISAISMSLMDVGNTHIHGTSTRRPGLYISVPVLDIGKMSGGKVYASKGALLETAAVREMLFRRRADTLHLRQNNSSLRVPAAPI